MINSCPVKDPGKRAAWVSLQEFIARNGYSWSIPSVDDAEAVVLAVASSEMSEESLAAWLAPKVVSP